jgi:hypothetical protein
MRFHFALIGAALAALNVTVVSAEVRIRNDPGGLIADHEFAFSQMRSAGERVVIDGRCYSACTLVLGIVPPDRVCVTSRAILGFHAAWVPGVDGEPIPSHAGTARMWQLYPAQIRRWLASKGGLSRTTIVLRGRELTSMVRTCR